MNTCASKQDLNGVDFVAPSGKVQGVWFTVTRRTPPMEAIGHNRFGGKIWGNFGAQDRRL
jgi:hypothetical protein